MYGFLFVATIVVSNAYTDTRSAESSVARTSAAKTGAGGMAG